MRDKDVWTFAHLCMLEILLYFILLFACAATADAYSDPGKVLKYNTALNIVYSKFAPWYLHM